MRAAADLSLLHCCSWFLWGNCWNGSDHTAVFNSPLSGIEMQINSFCLERIIATVFCNKLNWCEFSIRTHSWEDVRCARSSLTVRKRAAERRNLRNGLNGVWPVTWQWVQLSLTVLRWTDVTKPTISCPEGCFSKPGYKCVTSSPGNRQSQKKAGQEVYTRDASIRFFCSWYQF